MIFPLPKRLLAEAIGTFALVFAGTAAIVVDDQTHALTHVGVALTFGLVVFAMIASVGDVSGAHLNPAVSAAFAIARRMPARVAVAYALAQLSGAILASVAVRAIFATHATLGATLPAGSAMQSWLLEAICSAGLMFVILGVSTGAKEKGITAGLAIGATVAIEALVAGPICGASMNPARSFGPAIISGQLASLWIYLTAPFVGTALAVAGCACVRERGCCSGNLCVKELA